MNATQKSYLDSYFTKIKTSTNESQKKEQFIVLLTLLFPEKSNQIQEFARGSENFVKYYTEVKGESKTGFIDSFYGNLIIEFENDLSKTGKHAEDQLREYVSKIWSNEKEKSDYLCIASDCVGWVVYTPRLKKENLNSNTIKPADVELIKNEPFVAKISDAENFYLWLDRVFFRQNSIYPSGAMICAEFGVNSPHFTKSIEGLSEIFSRAQGMKEVQIAFKNWKKYLKYTYGDIDASEKLFLTHTYLSVFTKIMMAEVLSIKSKMSFEIDDLKNVLTGKFFYNFNIRNYVEKDFFFWINYSQFSDILEKQWITIFHLLKAYDFSKIDNDFLKDIYQGLIDPEDRHDLGEHYTPDWLCEKIINEALVKHENKIPVIADITCGSGSFLRLAVNSIRQKFLNKKNPSPKDKNKFANEITSSVIGFEIHPLACFIAKTNYMLAMEDLLVNLEAPIHIPIFLCDSLLNSNLDQLNIAERGKFSIFLDDVEYEFPLIKALTDDRFDTIVDFIDFITHSHSKLDDLSEEKIEKLLLQKIAPELIDNSNNFELLMASLIRITKDLHVKVLNHENTIWSFVLKNNFRPIAFTNQVDVIVGNPPWLTFKDVGSGLYRKELEYLGLTKYQIAPKNGKLRTQMELSTIFLVHAVDAYLKTNGFVYFVLPRSLFSADHHTNFREQTYLANMNLEEIWDLYDVNPLFRVPSCVVIASHSKKIVTKKINGKVYSGKLSKFNAILSEALVDLKINNKPFHLIKLNTRTAFSNQKISFQAKDNYYQILFKQGATILPRSYYFVETVNDFDTKKVVSINTEKSIIKNAKKPYNTVNLKGRANVEFLFRTLLAENILPYSVSNPFIIHLPILKNGTNWEYITADSMTSHGFTDSAEWFTQVEASFKKLSGNKMTSFERLNFHNGLLSQSPKKKYWVIYCSAGKNVCASVYVNKNLLWVEHKNYWFCPDTKEEAYYLAAVLNSSFVNEIIKPFQTKGLLGERDIEKKILEVGIPKFNPTDPRFIDLSNLAEDLSKKIQKVQNEFNTQSTSSKRSKVRQKFKVEFDEINQKVIELFEN